MSDNKYDFTLDTAEKNDSHMGLATRIKPNQRVLELGCSNGYLSKFLAQELTCEVVGVDINQNTLLKAASYCQQTIVADLDTDSWLTEIQGQQFDVVLCADVLEHLKDPVAMLASLKPFLHKESRLLTSVPNVAHASIRLELLQGHFDYEKLGLLDDTHLHFYTRDGLIAMLMQAGYVCCDISYSIQDMADGAIDLHLANVGLEATEQAREILHAPDAVAYQFIIEARPVQAELAEHLPQPLTSKPLVSSGVFYGEKQEKIGALEQQLAIESEHNKHHQKHVAQLEQQQSVDLEHHQKHISQLEQLVFVEQKHNKNHQIHIQKLEEKIASLEQQLHATEEHKHNYQQAIKAWQETTQVLDNALFDLSTKLHQETEKNSHLSSTVTHLQDSANYLTVENQNLEQVLLRVHKKISYRVVRGVKNTPKKISGLLRKTETTPQQAAIDHFNYDAWLATYGDLTKKELSAFSEEANSWQEAHRIAVLMLVYNPDKACLVNAIESVLQQVYANFELCIADDASTASYVREVLQSYMDKDSRVKVVFREQNGHISAASNSALSLVEAEYVALMDHDDLLTPDALYWVAKTIQQNPDVQLIYSDEDKMDLQGKRYAPYFKQDWNPELLLSHNYICHLGVYKTEQVKTLGGFDSAFDGAQDYDLALRYMEELKAEQIVHIPRILYHWRAVAGSTANGVQEKPYAEGKIAKAVASALERQQRSAEILAHKKLPGALRVHYLLPETLPLVSIVIPTRNGFHLLHRCIESIIAKTTYANYELIIIDNGSDDLVALRYLQRLQKSGQATIIRDDSPFNYAALNNKAVAQANGEIIALLNNDLEVINADWLDEMVSHVVHAEVGAVGAKLYYPDNTIQHAGVIVGLGGVAGHSHKHFPREHPGYCGRLLLAQNLSAVTAACLLVRKEVFDAVGGFDEQNLSVAFNDVDLCLRIQEVGFYNVWTPYAEMYHYESASRGYEDTPEKQARFNKEVAYMKRRWGEDLLQDPAYNPNLTLDRENFSFAWPPRNS
jgi:GT2 family glycosyltransferase/2-polyprenyl-3-methyl-5-hydroxy-6-metoxy-1,4-benzoquinol methylase